MREPFADASDGTVQKDRRGRDRKSSGRWAGSVARAIERVAVRRLIKKIDGRA